MKKRAWLIAILSAVAVLCCLLAACGGSHTHRWLRIGYKTPPTCTEPGIGIMECECGEQDLQEVPPLGHTWELISISPGSCIREGYRYSTCPRCGEERQENLGYGDHSIEYEGENKAPTCTEDGWNSAGVCTLCEQEFPYEELPALGHDYQNGVCNRCGETQICIVTYHDEYNELFTIGIEYGGTFDETPPEVIPEDCVFKGWYNEDGTQRYRENFVLREDLDVYAKWDVTHRISDADGLIAIKDAPTENYYLASDIRMNGAAWEPIENFSGILDGRGHKIVDMNLTDGKAGYDFAMFLTNDGEIRDLEIYDITYNAVNNRDNRAKASYFSVLVAHNNGLIEGCSITTGVYKYTYNPVDCNQSFYFGLISAINKGRVKSCFATVDVTCDIDGSANGSDVDFGGSIYNGGIVGGNTGTVTSCHYIGTFFTTNDPRGLHSQGYYGGHYYSNQYNHCYFGGIAGTQNGGKLTESYAEFTYNNTRSTVNLSHVCGNIGGLVGSNLGGGSITGCFATGSIYDRACNGTVAGGIVAVNSEKSVVDNCHADVDITADPASIYDETTAIGGLVGENNATVQNCYCCGDIDAHANGTVGGFAGKNNAQGSIGKCYSTGNAIVAKGSGDFFTGTSGGTLFKCYYLESASVRVKENYLEAPAQGLPKPYSVLWSSEFLVDTLYWDDAGWVILVNGDPMLEWEIGIGHEYTTETVDATCEDFGYTVYQCKDCGRMFVRDYVAPTGHGKTFVSHTDATCEEPGKTKYHCDACGIDYEVIEPLEPARGHQSTVAEGDEKVDPTCEKREDGEFISQDGRTAKVTCARCGEVLEESVTIPAHNFTVDKGNSTAPDCTNDGTTRLVCSDCGYTKDVTVPATGHKLKAGSLKCTVCQEDVYDESIFTKINTVDGLKDIVKDLSGYYMLTGNIDLSGQTWTPIGTEKKPFLGVLYGNGFKISGLVQQNAKICGLFGYNSGSILNLTLENVTFEIRDIDDALLGAFAAENGPDGKIENCTLSGNVRFTVGVRRVSNTFSGVSSAHTVTVGGIAANNKGSIGGCTVSARIEMYEQNEFVNTAPVDVHFYLDRGWKQGVSSFTAFAFAGGIAGKNVGTVEGCTAGDFAYSITQIIDVERVSNEGKWNEVRYKAGKMELNASVCGGSLVGQNSGTVTECTGGGFTVTRGHGTQDDSSSFFSLTHRVEVLTDKAYPQLLGRNDGTCEDLWTA